MVRLTSSVQRVNNGRNGANYVNQYRLFSEAGQGTFSTVRWAEDDSGKCFAVKVFSNAELDRRHVAHWDKDGASQIPLRDKINEEIRILGGLAHRNICRMEEVIDDPSHHIFYVVMEGLLGGQLMNWNESKHAYSLFSTLVEQEVSVHVYKELTAKYVFAQVIDGVAYLHQQGIVHKDLKPENIVLTVPIPSVSADEYGLSRLISLQGWPSISEPDCADGLKIQTSFKGEINQQNEASFFEHLDKLLLTAKVVDFNNAVETTPPECLIYDAIGTNLFTPPECFEGASTGIHGQPRDVWSLGCILFVMLFGRCPFWADENIMLQLSIMVGDFDLPEDVVSSSTENFLRLLMSKNPASRPLACEARQHDWLSQTPLRSC